MRFKKSKTVPDCYELWINDTSEASCGENRSNWTMVELVNITTLGKAVIEMAKGVESVSA